LSNQLKALKLVSLEEILAVVPVSKSTWKRGVRSGIYPQAKQIGMKRVAWLESEIIDFIKSLPDANNLM